MSLTVGDLIRAIGNGSESSLLILLADRYCTCTLQRVVVSNLAPHPKKLAAYQQ